MRHCHCLHWHTSGWYYGRFQSYFNAALRLYFKIYYADGTVLQGETWEDWRQMPSEKVLVVTEIYAATYGHPKKHAGKRTAYVDYYWMTPDEKISGGDAGNIPADAVVKAGAWTD